jgi:hypothetical protein
VPVTAPLAESTRPGGSGSSVENLYGGAPPTAEMTATYGVDVDPAGTESVVIVRLWPILSARSRDARAAGWEESETATVIL